MTPYHPVTWQGACALPILFLNRPIYIAFIHYSAMDQARSKKMAVSMLRWISTQIQRFSSKGAWLRVTWPNFEILGSYITFERIELSNSNLVQTWRTGPLVRADHKTTPKWAWLRVTWPNFNILGPFITYERIDLYPLEIWYTNKGWTFPP